MQYRLAWKNISGYIGHGNFDFKNKEIAEREAKHKTKISGGFFNFWAESEEDASKIIIMTRERKKYKIVFNKNLKNVII